MEKMSLPNDFYQHSLSAASVKLVIKDVLPRAEMQLAIGDGNDDFAAHDLPFVVCVGVVLAGLIVVIPVRRRVEGSQLFEPFFVIAMQSRLVVIDENAGCDVHRIYEYETVSNAAFVDESFDVFMDRDNRPTLGDFHPEFFREGLHAMSLRREVANSKTRIP